MAAELRVALGKKDQKTRSSLNQAKSSESAAFTHENTSSF